VLTVEKTVDQKAEQTVD
jgi:hypothetical protein